MSRWPLLLLALTLSVTLADNLYPDPGFEQTGTAGVARSGERAMTLTVGARQHWVTTGGAFPVEPFATYRATAYAKARYQQGQALALYFYQWDSYVWAFAGNVPIANGKDWQAVSVTIRAPQDVVYLHPLAFMDAAEGQAWVDDVVVERVKSPDETIAELRAKPELGGDDARLLARWFIQHKQPELAEQLLERPLDRVVKADIACVLGQATTDPDRRLRFLVAMVANGAASLNDGLKRITEVGDGIEPQRVLGALVDRMAAAQDDPAAAKTLVGYLRSQVATSTSLPETLAARKARLDGPLATLDSVLAKLAPAAAGRTELTALRDELTASRAKLEADMAHLGTCTVTLGGQPVTAATTAIILSAEPSPSERRAAMDLQAHLERITGQVIPLVGPARPQGKALIVVGRNPLVAKLGVAVDYDQLGVEGIRQKTVGKDLVLTGNQRGVLYAVYQFLEDQLGCRWFTADCATWPTRGKLAVGPLDVTYVPALEYRATDYPNSRPPEFAVRNRLNGAQVAADDPAWGGHVTYRGFVHTFNSLVPPEQYAAAHPEYYSEVDGKRIRDYAQLCLTNPDVLRIATETVRRWIREDPKATIISVSQNDWHNPCQCPNCRKITEAEGSESGTLLRFVNAVADAIAKDHPGIVIDTLAYQYTRKPPKVTRPRPNVCVRLCSIECEFNRPLESSTYNHTFVEDIQGWNKLSQRLYIWDYVINYAHSIMPFPNLKVLQPNIKFFIRNGVKGIYEEADYYTKGGELAELRTYLMAKLLWNPDYDVEKATNEFLAAYYGTAARPIRAYLDEVHRLATVDPDYHLRIYMGPNAPFLTEEAMAKYERWFDQAEAAVAGDPVRLHRVQVARMPILYTRIAQHSAAAYQLGDTALTPVTTNSVGNAAERFAAIARAEGVSKVSEGSADLEAWLERIGPGPREIPLVKLSAGALTARVAPGLGGRVVSLRRGEQELLQVKAVPGGIDPTTGGYKEFSESGYQSPGWVEPYSVVESSATAVTVRSKPLSNGLVYERRYELAPTGLTVLSTLTNPGATPRKARIRVHPCFRLEDARQAKLKVGSRTRDLADGATRESDVWLRDADRPAGSWTLIDPAARVSITQVFDPRDCDLCLFNWNGPDQRANLELWGPEKTLAQGERLTLKQEYRIGES